MPALAPIYPFLTGQAFLEFICHVKKQPWPNELIGAFNLQRHLQTEFVSMSYGTKKKFLFIASMISQPRYLILDELINGLDQASADIMNQIILKHLGVGENLCVIVTHDERLLLEWQKHAPYQAYTLSAHEPVSDEALMV